MKLPPSCPESFSKLTFRLGNIYLLLAMVGIAVLYTTTEPKVVHNYVIALWLADIGHVAVTCWVMEYEKLIDVANWNVLTWGNIGATVSIISEIMNPQLIRHKVGLFTVRTAYLLGLFGPDCKPASKRQ